jgi:hypothetical protein
VAPVSGPDLDPDPDPGLDRGVGLAEAAVAGPDLLERFAGISDRRSDQGREHPVAVVLTLCAAAVLAGMRSFTAIAGWITDARRHPLPPP